MSAVAAMAAIHAHAPTRPHPAETEYHDEVGRPREYKDSGLAGLINRIERGTGWDFDGDGKVGETGDLKPTAQESARAKLRPVVDLSRWVLEARVSHPQPSAGGLQRHRAAPPRCHDERAARRETEETRRVVHGHHQACGLSSHSMGHPCGANRALRHEA